MTVLIVTRAGIPVDAVVATLAGRGVQAVSLATDTVPRTTAVSLRDDGTVVLHVDGAPARVLTDLTAVWYRRMAIDPDLPAGSSRELQRVVRDELRSFLFGLLSAARVPVFGPKWVLDHADLRPRQLSVARAAGLDVPRAITTTDLAAAREFVRACGGSAITKLYTSVPVAHDAQSADVMMTSAITSEALAHFHEDELKLCPATFQEHLDKAAEYRVTIVGQQVFAARVCAVGTAGEVDWRRAGVELGQAWAPAVLPEPVRAALLRLMDRLQLDYGAADIVETTCGRFVFLEVNPAGEYLWLAPLFGNAVNEALADLLTGVVPSRVHGQWR